jgi:Zn finger protein HypA/HybF involved in hydrogenase expression
MSTYSEETMERTYAKCEDCGHEDFFHTFPAGWDPEDKTPVDICPECQSNDVTVWTEEAR